MVLCVHTTPFNNMADGTLCIYQEGGAYCAHEFFSHHRFFFPHTKLLCQFLVTVSNQWKWEGEFFDEFFMRHLTVDAHTHDLKTRSPQFGISVAQAACLCCASGGVIFRIEIECQLFTCEVARFYRISVLIGTYIFRYSIANM